MGKSERSTAKQDKKFYDKRCPYCATHLKLDALVCAECKRKVGTVDKAGRAKKPFNFKAYLAAVLWIAVFCIYIWLAFFKLRNPF